MSNVDWRNAVPQARSVKAGSGVMAAIAVGVATIIFAVCIVAYSNHSAKLARLDLEAQEARRLEQEREQREQQARRFAEQDEYERELRRRRLEREEEELRLLAEKKNRNDNDNAAAAKCNNDDIAAVYRAARVRFGVSARFSSELPKDASRDVFFCIFTSYRNDKLIYKVELRKGESMKVTAISPTAAPAELDTPSFKSRMRKEPFAAAIDGGVWIYGITSPSGKTFPVPPRGTDFSLYDAVFGAEFGEALSVVGIQPPKKRFVCSLRRTKGNVSVWKIAETGFDRALERTEIEAVVSKELNRRFLRAIDDKRKKIVKTFEKKRKALGNPIYKRKYVFYNGSCVMKTLNKVFVPRETYRGDSGYYGLAAAEEKAAAKYEAEYLDKMSVIDEEEKIALSALERNSVSDEDVDAALSQHELIISGDTFP